MSTLPDPSTNLTGADREAYDRMASARAHAEGRAQIGDVYVAMFNNPGVAAKVGALGEHLRFHATLPDDVRELIILRFAAQHQSGYEWSHHQRPARLAGVDQDVIDELTTGALPAIEDSSRAALQAVDAIVGGGSIPADVQERFTAVHGNDGIVELVVLCGLYSTMRYMVNAFDIEIEDGLPSPPF